MKSEVRDMCPWDARVWVWVQRVLIQETQELRKVPDTGTNSTENIRTGPASIAGVPSG